MSDRTIDDMEDIIDPLLMRKKSGKFIAQTLAGLGYSRPRTVSTVAELDALIAESVVRSSVGVVWEKYADDYADEGPVDFWQQVGMQRMYASSKITLPASVLYEPEGK